MNWRKLSKLLPIVFAICMCSLSYAEAVWIDVRSSLEHKLDNIEGDIRISHGQIVENTGKLYPDRNTEIYLYCRSGNRAGKAMSALKEAGYTNVSNVGSIGDARKLRDIKESEIK